MGMACDTFWIKECNYLLSRGLYAQVQDIIARCEQCDKMRTSPLKSSCFFHSLFRACFIVGRVI